MTDTTNTDLLPGENPETANQNAYLAPIVGSNPLISFIVVIGILVIIFYLIKSSYGNNSNG
jgi:hypothetical protein